MSSSPNSSSSKDADGGKSDASRLQDVLCRVEVVLGTGTVSVRDCLGLRRQHVLKLSQAAGADLQVRVNGVPIALGEVVIVDDSTSIRLTEITPPPSASRPE
jgi:flagellar motor switch protein FliN